MPEKIKTLLLTGGGVHDHEGCGKVIRSILEQDGQFDVTHLENDLNIFIRPEMGQFDALLMYWTVGEISDEQLVGLSNWIKGGGGLISVHGGAASFKESPDYRALLGGYLVMHPRYRPYQVSVLDKDHEITQGLDEFTVTDEQYICSYDNRVNVLANALYDGVAHPVIWTKPWGNGQICFLALGHDVEACQDENFEMLLKRGTVWAARKN